MLRYVGWFMTCLFLDDDSCDVGAGYECHAAYGDSDGVHGAREVGGEIRVADL